ncbi:MAG: selenocysteine-specific translation elongation factor [Phycisphaerae bacterium]|jgi:selenocysteine-specific elongation factor
MKAGPNMSEPQTAPTNQEADAKDQPSRKRHLILGTAGHIDHGKTSLVKVLTGTDADRLPEEQRRGMTIELGFAGLTIGDLQFGVVDVPGHERFVRTMVAGATGIDVALVVVAADDSVMPQTIEHVEILQLLGVRHGVVAVTKIDTVEDDMVELVSEEVRELVSGTPLAGAPICPVSSATGDGVDKLKSALAAVAQRVDGAPTQVPFRMAVDRAFTVQGRGTVVTGSILRGQVSSGDILEVKPSGEKCRVRDLQTHGATCTALARGQRAAINISGIEREQVQRGAELATPGYLQSSRIIDVKLSCLPTYARSLKSTRTVRLEIGTVEHPARVVLLHGGVLEPGQSAYAQLRSGDPITSVYGQRFILRDENATRTIGGGFVLRPVAYRRRRTIEAEERSLTRLENGDEADRLEEVLRATRFTTPTELQLCARAGVELSAVPEMLSRLRTSNRWVPIAGTGAYAVPAAVDDLAQRLTNWLERHHRNHPELPGRLVDTVIGWLERMTNRSLARPLFEYFVKKKKLKTLGQFVCLPAFAPSLTSADERLMGTMIEEIKAGGFQPPGLGNLTVSSQGDKKRWDRLATLAVALGELVKVDSAIYLHAEVERELRERLSRLINEVGGVSVSEVREALDSSRKYVVPFLEYLDRIGFTKRSGDQRVLAEPVEQG